MKTNLKNLALTGCGAAVLAFLFISAAVSATLGADSTYATSSVKPEDNEGEADAKSNVTVETGAATESTQKEVTWLGVSTVEATEALSSQLDLKPGVGLLVTYVAPDSPAAKSGLRKNDVLTEFDDQALVHPAQFRKLVHVRKEGDTINLAYYRAGKKQNHSVTLGKTKAQTKLWGMDNPDWQESFKGLQNQFRDLHLDEKMRDQVKVLRDSLGNIKIDQNEVKEDIRRGMEEGQKAIREALRNLTNADPVKKMLENFAHSGVVVDDKADVVVRSSRHNSKSLVKSDDSGTIVLVSNPKLHLTAHDKEGKLLFDGSIESADDRTKVPPELWDRVEPLVNQMHADTEQPEEKE